MTQMLQKKIFPFLMLVVAACSSLPIILYHLSGTSVTLSEQQFLNQQNQLLDQTRIGLQGGIQQLIRELTFLADHESLKSGDQERSSKVMQNSFSQMLQCCVTDIILLNRNGIVLSAASTPQLTGEDSSANDYFKETRILTTQKPIFDFIILRDQAVAQQGMIIALPIFDQTETFNGTILFVIKVNELFSRFLPYNKDNHLGATWAIDNQGRFLYHPQHPQGTMIGKMTEIDSSFKTFLTNIKAGKPLANEYFSPHGKRFLAVTQPLSLADENWTLVISTPESQVKALLSQLTTPYKIGGALAILLIGGSATLLAMFFYRAQRTLAEEVIERTQAERKLQLAHNQLEQRVEDRTREIRQANIRLQKEFDRRFDIEQALRTLAEKVSAETGDMFFQSLANYLNNTFKLDLVLIGRLKAPNSSELQTRVVLVKGQREDNFDFDYQQTFLQPLLHNTQILLTNQADINFPFGPQQSTRWQSCLAATLYDAHGNILGLLCGLSSTALENSDLAQSILQIVATRASSELEREQREEQLLGARKLESIGRLTAGIAHEINNPLTNASLGMEMLRGMLKDCAIPEAANGKLSSVERNIDRASEIARELLLFSRQRGLELQPLNLSELLTESLRMVRRNLENIDINTDFSDTPVIIGDRIKLEGLFINLFNNAAEAMPDGGRIDLKTSFDEQREAALVTVNDSGYGIPEQHLERVFDPFFTTKEVGEGTGLGLSIVHGIVKSHGGELELNSQVGAGTTIKIWLPGQKRKRDETNTGC